MHKTKQHRFSKIFRHTFKACAFYIMLWAIAILALLIGALFDFFQAIASLVFPIIPNLLRLGCILTIAVIVAVVYEGIRQDIKRDD